MKRRDPNPPLFRFTDCIGKGLCENGSKGLIPESCTKCRSEAPKAFDLRRSWSDFDPQAYYPYGEDQNHEASFIVKALQAAVDDWRIIRVKYKLLSFSNLAILSLNFLDEFNAQNQDGFNILSKIGLISGLL